MAQTVLKRLYKKNEFLEVFALFTQRFLSLRKGETYCEALAQKYEDNAQFFALYSDGETAAFAAFYCNDKTNKTAYLSLIGVLERFEGNGFGGILLDKVIEVSRSNGMEKLALEVRKSNERAISMYQKRDFIIKKQKDKNMLIMSRDL